LRTPLNSLLILARLLTDNADRNLNQKQLEFAQIIHSSGTDLMSLINDILDLAKIESGTVTLNIASEHISDLCAFVERAFRQVAQNRELEFTVTVDAAMPQTIETDGKRLQQIIKNLLANAFKFTEKGKVSLHIGLTTFGWSENHSLASGSAMAVAFAVTDTGIGIPANKQKLIFDAFQQADGTTSREYGGTGLGLSISRELARLLGGEIRLVSVPGGGSTFTLYVPLVYLSATEPDVAEVADEQETTKARHGTALVASAKGVADQTVPPEAAKELAGKVVLLVDDDIRNVFALTNALEQNGMAVIHAEDGKGAIDMLKCSADVDAVLMDLMMPGMDGYDTIRIIRQEENYRTLPIIAVTAKAMPDDSEKCLRAGATDYIAKPVNIDMLLAMLWHHISDHRATIAAPPPRSENF
jgi:CheY-like chemotaxis protein/predicted nucleic acid-binding protein